MAMQRIKTKIKGQPLENVGPVVEYSGCDHFSAAQAYGYPLEERV
jgi:hypothetical protein